MSFDLIMPEKFQGGRYKFLAISDELKNVIGEQYNEGKGLTVKILSENYNLSTNTIKDILRACQIPKQRKKYTLDENCFEKIDNHEKAYVLGFIMGDGNIKDRITCIEINRKDEEILYKIRDVLKSNAPIKQRQGLRKETITYSSYINFCNTKMRNDLVNLGLSHNKTFDLKYPNILEEFDNSFILGLFDADGSIRAASNKINKWGAAYWEIMATPDMNLVINEKLHSWGINSKYTENNYFKCPLSNVTLSKKSEIIKLREILYRNSPIYLKRKYEAFLNVKYQDKK